MDVYVTGLGVVLLDVLALDFLRRLVFGVLMTSCLLRRLTLRSVTCVLVFDRLVA